MAEHDLTDIDDRTLEMVPYRIARGYCVLPQSFTDDAAILFCPNDTDFELQNADSLRFALDRTVTWIPISRDVIERAIDHHYPEFAISIQNCDVGFKFHCPKIWSELARLDDDLQRHCSECDRIVYHCINAAEAAKLGAEGKCVAFVDIEHGEVLGEIDCD